MDNSNFFSIDKLVEFGMGMSIAQQMVGTMNQSLQNMYVPGSVAHTMPAPQPITIYVAVNGQPVGPITESQFAEMVTKKQVTKDTLVWTPGMASWKPVEQVPTALRIIAMAPPPLPEAPAPAPEPNTSLPQL